MIIFESKNYKKYVKNRLLNMPKGGHGQLIKLSKFLDVQTSFLSQVFSGPKNLSAEQAIKTAEFFGLSDLESECFLLLVQLEKSGNKELTAFLNKQLSKVQEASKRISNRLKNETVLSESTKAVFYSDWFYSAIRQLPAISDSYTIDAISEHLNLNRKIVSEVVRFLLENKLLQEENSKLKVGPSRTHLEPESPWIKSHHTNWRLRSLESIKNTDAEKLHFTFPVTLSKADAAVVRSKLANLIQEIGAIVEPSPSEELRCLNIDWFKI